MKISGPHTLPADHMTLVGEITNAWAQLEFEIDRGIWELLQTQHQLAACVTAQLSFVHPKIKAFIALVQLHGGDKKMLDDLNEFYSVRISGLSELRNRCAHDTRMLDADTRTVHRFENTAKPKIKFGWFHETTQDLQKLHDNIYNVIGDFGDLRDMTVNALRALPPSSRPPLVSIVPVTRAIPVQKSDTPEPDPQPQA